MEEKITKSLIIDYLNSLKPDPADFSEVARTSNELKDIIGAVLGLSERLNASRRVKLLKSETEQLNIESARLQDEITVAAELNEDYQRLAAQREKLIADKKNITDLDQQREEIVQLQAIVARHNIAALSASLHQLQMEARCDIKDLHLFLEEAIPFFTQLNGAFLRETKELFVKLKQRQHQANVVIIDANEVLQEEQLALSDRLKHYNKELRDVLSTYNALSSQLAAVKIKLLDTKENHQKNVASYQLHFDQNKAIYGELGKQHQLVRHLSGLFETIEKDLQIFDLEIKTLVENADQITIF